MLTVNKCASKRRYWDVSYNGILIQRLFCQTTAIAAAKKYAKLYHIKFEG